VATTLFNQLIQADTLTFDNVDRVRVRATVDATGHPIETGVEVNEHAQKMPLEIVCRARVTETPIGEPLPSAVELSLAFFERSERELMTFVCSRGTFASMLITSYEWEVKGGEIVYDFTLKRIALATPVSVLIPPRVPTPPVQAGAASAADAGAQPPIPAAPPPTSVLGALASFAF